MIIECPTTVKLFNHLQPLKTVQPFIKPWLNINPVNLRMRSTSAYTHYREAHAKVPAILSVDLCILAIVDVVDDTKGNY